MRRTILLLNPYIGPFQTDLVSQVRSICQPLSLGVIAHLLQDANVPFHFLDANALDLSPRDTLKQIHELQPDVVLATTTHDIDYDQPRLSLQDIAAVGSGLPNHSLLILMGTHGTIWPDKTLGEIPRTSIIIRGEPEITAEQLLRCLHDGSSYSEVPGISYRSTSGQSCHNPSRPFLNNLSALPLPSYDLMPMERYIAPYRNTNLRSASMMTSRGCPIGCYYCCVHIMSGRTFRSKTVDRITEELALLAESFQVRFVHFIDDNFNYSHDRLHDLCMKMVEVALPITWYAQMTLPADDTQERTFKAMFPLMSRAGCSGFSVGLESVSPEVRRFIPKTDPDRFVRVQAEARTSGISVFPNNMVGLIGETRQSLKEQDKFFKIHGGMKRFNRAMTITRPGTPLYEIALKTGRISREDSWDKLANIAGQVGNDLTREDLVSNRNALDAIRPQTSPHFR